MILFDIIQLDEGFGPNTQQCKNLRKIVGKTAAANAKSKQFVQANSRKKRNLQGCLHLC